MKLPIEIKISGATYTTIKDQGEKGHQVITGVFEGVEVVKMTEGLFWWEIKVNRVDDPKCEEIIMDCYNLLKKCKKSV